MKSEMTKALTPLHLKKSKQIAIPVNDVNVSDHVVANNGSLEQSEEMSQGRHGATIIEMSATELSEPLITNAVAQTEPPDATGRPHRPRSTGWITHTIAFFYMTLIVLGTKTVLKMNQDKSIFNLGPSGEPEPHDNDNKSSSSVMRYVSELPASILDNNDRYATTMSMASGITGLPQEDDTDDIDKDAPMWGTEPEPSLADQYLPPLSDEIIAKEIALIRSLDHQPLPQAQSDLATRGNTNTESASSSQSELRIRTKREDSGKLVKQLKFQFKKFGVGPDYPSNFHEIRDSFENLAQEKLVQWNDRVRLENKGEPVFTEIQFLTELMREMNDVLNIHASDRNFEAPYHYIYMLYCRTWDLVDWLTRLRKPTNSIIKRFGTYPPAQQGNQLNPQKNIATTDVDMYLAHKHWDSWLKDRLTSSDEIVIHTKNEARIFTIKEIVEDKHASFIGNGVTLVHRRYDHTGQPDARTKKFVSSARAEEFREYTQTSEFNRFISKKVDLLYEQKLIHIRHSPLYLDKTDILKELHKEAGKSPLLLTSYGKNAILTAIDAKIAAPIRWQEQALAPMMAIIKAAMLAPDLFSNLDKEKLLLSDVLYQYSEQGNDSDHAAVKRTDTAMLVEYLCHKAGIAGMPIAHRRDVTVDFPTEFSSELRWKLVQLTDTIAKEWALVEHEIKLAKLKTTLTSSFPSLVKILQKKLGQLCDMHGFKGCELHEKVTLKFSKTGEELVTKEYTYAQLLLGEVKKFHAMHASRITTIAAYPSSVVTPKHQRKYEAFIKAMRLEHFDNTVDLYYKAASENVDLKETFDEYEKSVTSVVPVKNRHWLEFNQIPLLRLYFSDADQKNLGAIKTNLARNAGSSIRTGKIYLFSFLSESVIEFSSYPEFLNAVSQNDDLKRFIDSHASISQPLHTDISVFLTENPGQSSNYHSMLRFQKNYINRYITDFIEEQYLAFFQRAIDNKSTIVTPIELAYGAGAGLAAELAIAMVARLGQAMMLESEEERNTLAREALVDYLETAVGFAVGNVVSNYASKGFKLVAQHPNEQFSNKVSGVLMNRIDDILVKGLRLPASTRLSEEAFNKIAEKTPAYLAGKMVEPILDKFLKKLPPLLQATSKTPLARIPQTSYLDFRGNAGLLSLLPALSQQPIAQTPAKNKKVEWIGHSLYS